MSGFFPTKALVRYVLSIFEPEKSRSVSKKLCDKPGVCSISDVIRALYTKYGIGGMLKGDALLFGWALILTALSDLLLGKNPVLRTVIGALLCLFMCRPADDEPSRAFLKIAFIITNCSVGRSWVLTELFVILFEHIGIEGTDK